MAHTGRTWTRSSPSGTRPGGRSCGGRFSSSAMDGGMLVGLLPGSTVDTWSASAPGCLWMVCVMDSRILRSLPRTVVASVASLRRSHLEIGHYVYEPLVSGSSLFAAMLVSSVDTCYASAPGASGRFSS